MDRGKVGEKRGETGGGGRDRAEERGFRGYGGRTSGKTGRVRGLTRSGSDRALVEVVVGDGLGVGGIELWGLVEGAWSGTQGDLFRFRTAEIEVEAVWGGPRAGWSRGGEV